MSFESGCPSENDVKKYNLKEVLIKYRPELKDLLKDSFPIINWSIDHERNIFFIKLLPTVRDEPGVSRWLLSSGGEEVAVYIRADVGDGIKNKYLICWSLVSMRKVESSTKLKDVDIKSLLKEILMSRNSIDIFGKDLNAEIKFNF